MQTVWKMPAPSRVEYKAEPQTLEEMKEYYKARVEADAELQRQRYITAGFGKAMSYQEKVAEARLVLDDPNNIDESIVPILRKEAIARGISVQQAADRVHQQYLLFKDKEADINAISITKSLNISGASDAAAVQAAYEATPWPETP